jgi:hypothetical protein
MTETQYYERGRDLLRKIRRQRQWLLNHQCSQIPLDFTTTELNNIDYALSVIKKGAAMKSYFERKKDTLNILISAVNRKNHNELEFLIETDFNKTIC